MKISKHDQEGMKIVAELEKNVAKAFSSAIKMMRHEGREDFTIGELVGLVTSATVTVGDELAERGIK